MNGGRRLALWTRISGFIVLAASLYFVATAWSGHRDSTVAYLKHGALALFGLGMVLISYNRMRPRAVASLAVFLSLIASDAGTTLYDTQILDHLLLLWGLAVPGLIFLFALIFRQERRQNVANPDSAPSAKPVVDDR